MGEKENARRHAIKTKVPQMPRAILSVVTVADQRHGFAVP